MSSHDPAEPGPEPIRDPVNPLRKFFEEIEVGEEYTTHARTITEADVVNFACLTGDFYYLHVDREGARRSPYGRRIAHGLLIQSVATGLLVTSRPGPIVANYGSDKLRFVRPVYLGDTIRASVECVAKVERARPMQGRPVGIVDWKVNVSNQQDELVATWIFKTLVLCGP